MHHNSLKIAKLAFKETKISYQFIRYDVHYIPAEQKENIYHRGCNKEDDLNKF